MSNLKKNFEIHGVALMVEEAGQRAKVVLRYPSAEESNSSEMSHHPNLFHSMPNRVMEKLFRPMPPLCDKPLTLTVGRTIFCCRAATIQETVNDRQDNDIETQSESKLVLFSIIIALSYEKETKKYRDKTNSNPDLSPLQVQKSIRMIHDLLKRVCCILQREERRCDYVTRQASMLLAIIEEEKQRMTLFPSKSTHQSKESLSLSDGTHGSLCLSQGINLSSPNNMNMSLSAGVGNLNMNDNMGQSSFHPKSVIRNSSNQAHDGDGYMQVDSYNDPIRFENQQNVIELMLAATEFSSPYRGGNIARELAQIYHALSKSNNVQALSSSSLSTSAYDSIVYVNSHVAISVPSVYSICATRKGKTKDMSKRENDLAMGAIRPYHTILFPDDNSDQIRQPLQPNFSFSDNSQNLQKIILMSNPQKSIADISVAAALPLSKTIEIISSSLYPKSYQNYSFDSQVCDRAFIPFTISHVISKSTRFACKDNAPARIASLSLKFAQKFGSTTAGMNLSMAMGVGDVALPHLFSVVSAFTCSPFMTLPLGTILALLTSSPSLIQNEESSSLSSMLDYRNKVGHKYGNENEIINHHIQNDISYPDDRGSHIPMTMPDALKPLKRYVDCIAKKMNFVNHAANVIDLSGGSTLQPILSSALPMTIKKLENILFSMVVWLRAQNIIIDMRDYLVAKSTVPQMMHNCHDDGNHAQHQDDEHNVIPPDNYHALDEIKQQNNIPQKIDAENSYGDMNSDKKVSGGSFDLSTSSIAHKTSHNKSFFNEEEIIFDMLLKEQCLNGKISVVAICWKYNINKEKIKQFLEWGSRTRHVEVITRIPSHGDDWGAH